MKTLSVDNKHQQPVQPPVEDPCTNLSSTEEILDIDRPNPKKPNPYQNFDANEMLHT